VSPETEQDALHLAQVDPRHVAQALDLKSPVEALEHLVLGYHHSSLQRGGRFSKNAFAPSRLSSRRSELVPLHPLKGEPGRQRHLKTLGEGQLGRPDRPAGAIGDILGVLVDGVGEALPGEDPVDDSHLLCLLDAEDLVVEHQPQRPRGTDHPSQELRAALAGHDSQRELGHAQLPAALAREPEVASERQLEPPTHAVAVDGGDEDLGNAPGTEDDLLAGLAQEAYSVGRLVPDDIDVGAGGEVILAGAHKNDHTGVVVESGVEHGSVELQDHLKVVGVDRGAVQPEVSDPVSNLGFYELEVRVRQRRQLPDRAFLNHLMHSFVAGHGP